MTGSNSSIHGNRHGEEPPVARAELHQMADSLLQAMERMLDARIPADGQKAPRHQSDESGAENSNGGHDRFRDGRGGGRRLVIMAKMEDELMDVVVAIEFILMMKNLITLVAKRGLMRIPLQMMGCIGGAIIIGGMLIMEIEASSWTS